MSFMTEKQVRCVDGRPRSNLVYSIWKPLSLVFTTSRLDALSISQGLSVSSGLESA